MRNYGHTEMIGNMWERKISFYHVYSMNTWQKSDVY